VEPWTCFEDSDSVSSLVLILLAHEQGGMARFARYIFYLVYRLLCVLRGLNTQVSQDRGLKAQSSMTMFQCNRNISS